MTQIRIGTPPLSFYAVQGAVVAKVLAGAGFDTVVVHEFHETIYPMLHSGEIDVFVASWLPGAHGELWRSYGRKAVKLGPIFSGGAFYLAVPDYLADSGIVSLDSLGQSHVERDIVSVGPGGAALTSRARKAVSDYGLNEAGFRVDARPEAEWAEHAQRAYDERRAFAIALWRPCFLNAGIPLRPLKDPKGSMGPEDTGWITANQDFAAAADPLALALLGRICLGVGAITELDRLVVVEGLLPENAAERWVQENSDKVVEWTRVAREGMRSL